METVLAMLKVIIEKFENYFRRKREEKEFIKSIKNLSEAEKAVLREFEIQSRDYIKTIKANDVFILADKNFIVQVQSEKENIPQFKKTDIARKLLKNTDIGFPQGKITEKIKKEFEGKRPYWAYQQPQQSKGIRIAGNILGLR